MSSKQVVNKNKNTRGFFPYSWMDVRYEDSSVDMVKLSPETVSLTKLDDLTDNHQPEIYKLVEDYQNPKKQKKMKKKDKMKAENFISQRKRIEDDDIISLSKVGITYQPTTNIGKMTKLMEVLKRLHLSMNEDQALIISLRLMEEPYKSFVKDSNIKKKYQRHLQWLEKLVEKTDMVKYQLFIKHEMLPPLNEKGFNKLDDWQIETIKDMRNNKSLILSIPTSGGKTYLSAYLTKLGAVLFIAPSVPLARQVAAYLTRVTGEAVPFMTDTYRTKFYHNDMLELLKKSKYVVSTPVTYLDFLPETGLFNQDNASLVLDEIHMMGSEQGDAMETIAILNSKLRLVGLSATISNTEDLKQWRSDLKMISSKKRFFNLQVAYWDESSKSIENINPLALISYQDFEDGSILKKEMKPTSPDVYQLYQTIIKYFSDMKNLDIQEYFKVASEERINLNTVLKYYYQLIEFMVNKNKTEPEKIRSILSEFKPLHLKEDNTDLVDLVLKLKEEKNLPTLVFQRNTYSLMRLAKKFLKEIDRREDKEFPERLEEHEKMEKEAKKRQKEMEKLGLLDKSLKEDKLNKMKESLDMELIHVTHHQKPTEKYHFNSIMTSENDILTFNDDLKFCFAPNGDYMHPIIHALWRGIGIYAEGLPEDYLILVQHLANQKKLGIVLSDKSMTFGVSMPFRNVVIYRDLEVIDDLNPLLFKQMEGRAGRRGQDTKGSVVFAGYSFDRIKELTVSVIPKVKGQESIENIYLPIGQKLAQVCQNEVDFKKIFQHNLSYQQSKKKYSDEEIDQQWSDLTNVWKSWAPKAMLEDDKERLKLLWQSRTYGCDGITMYHLIDTLEKHFAGGDIAEKRQVEASHILSYFIQNHQYSKKEDKMKLPNNLYKWKPIRDALKEAGIPLLDEEKLDGRIFKSIKDNKLVICDNDKEYELIRTRFIKFANAFRLLQNYCYYSNRVTVTRILGKLFTRCKWIIYNSSPLKCF